MSLREVRPEYTRDLPPGPAVFTQEEIRCLEEDRIFLPQPKPDITGNRKVSAIFNAPRSVIRSLPSPSASVRIRGFQSDVIQTFRIPMEEESIGVLEYIGFVPDTARIIYERYINRPDPDQNPDDLMRYACGHICSLKARRYENVSHKEALRQIGLNLQIQEAITDPRFSHVFATETLYYWTKDTIQTNYISLLSRQTRLRNYTDQHSKKYKRPTDQKNLQQDKSQDSVESAVINMTLRDFQFPEKHVVMQTEMDTLNDHISLYKVKAHERWYNYDCIINDDGTVNLAPLLKYDGDTNWVMASYYWTPEKETAEEYRQYAAGRCPMSETCIIRIQIPWSFVNRLHRENLWYSPDWKEYVWTCRKAMKPHQKFHRLLNAELVISHICSSMSTHVTHIPSQDVQTRITEDDVMRLPSGRKAVQWMFPGDIVELLEKEIRGKIHIDIFEATI
ncbi:hypothetical protein Plec18167_009439 [Paecilomyces lecythidis]|uniref:Uncharacterized protein n=1 Tax=Paecilomyces lecythidis TaxID=3004212 RepID=A0ABR3WPA5_9EURO